MSEVLVDTDTYIAKLREQRNLHCDGEAALAGQLGAAVATIRDRDATIKGLTEKVEKLEEKDGVGKDTGKAKFGDKSGKANGPDKAKGATA